MKKKNKKLQAAKYLFFDFLSAGVSWTILFAFRKAVINTKKFGIDIPITFDQKYLLGLLLISFFWVSLYLITGTYNHIYRKSRLKEFVNTLFISLAGNVLIFFVLILDDEILTYKDYYESFFILFSGHFILTASFRVTLSSITNYRVQNRIIGFNTLLIGSNENAVELFNELENNKKSAGNKFIGFASVNNNIQYLIEKELQYLGSYRDINEIINQYNIEEVIIAIESKEHGKLEEIINLLENSNVIIKMIPDTYNIISGQVRMQSLFGAPLIEIDHELMPVWQIIVKRVFDVVFSLILLVLSSPVMLFCAIMVPLSSKGPIFFRQERVGLNQKKFNIIKFRSMFEDAEKNGPQLSSKDDSRITPWGKIMRKFRLDELPQFFNVLIGEMSIVGPRPERSYYIEQIRTVEPLYKYVHRVKPGITSWGMVKFGYAENIDEMVQRLKYDIIYIENMNLYNDLKILIYTVLIVLQGRGK